YYVGRSDPHVLVMIFPAWALALLLLAWSCWEGLMPRLRSEGWRALTPAALLLAAGYAAMAGCVSDRPNLAKQVRRLTTRRDEAGFAAPLVGGVEARGQC